MGFERSEYQSRKQAPSLPKNARIRKSMRIQTCTTYLVGRRAMTEKVAGYSSEEPVAEQVIPD